MCEPPNPTPSEGETPLAMETLKEILNARRELDKELDRLKANGKRADQLSLVFGVFLPTLALLLALAGLIFVSKPLVDGWTSPAIAEAIKGEREARESWQRGAVARIMTIEQSGRMLSGVVNIGDKESPFGSGSVNGGWHEAKLDVEFPSGYFRRAPVIFVSVTSVTFHRHDAVPFAYWVQANDGSKDGFQARALVGNGPPEEFGGFRVTWLAIEPREDP